MFQGYSGGIWDVPGSLRDVPGTSRWFQEFSGVLSGFRGVLVSFSKRRPMKLQWSSKRLLVGGGDQEHYNPVNQ